VAEHMNILPEDALATDFFIYIHSMMRHIFGNRCWRIDIEQRKAISGAYVEWMANSQCACGKTGGKICSLSQFPGLHKI
jgi:hypothetical protein